MELMENFSYSPNNPKNNKVQEILDKSVQKIHDLSSESSTIALNLNISEITGSVFLCSATALHTSTLQALGVTCVINAAIELPDTPLPSSVATYYRINVHDSSNENIKDYFDTASDLIHEVACSGGKTLLHCIAGVSRSAAVCIAYVMKYHRLPLLDAYKYVKLKRPIVRPNCGFFKQLIEYEIDLFGTNSVSMIYNEFFNTELPDVYNAEYKGTICFRQKHKNARN